MTRTEVSRTIAASSAVVFQAVSDVSNFAKAVPAIRRIEFLSEVRNGVGTRFRETRVMGKRNAVAEMEVVDYAEGERICLRSDEGGAVWDSTFTVAPVGNDRTRLDLVMTARPYRLLAKLFVPVARGMVAKAVASDMDALKAYCESSASVPVHQDGGEGHG